MWDKWKRHTTTWPGFALMLVMVFALFLGLNYLNGRDLAAANKEKSDLQVALSIAEAQKLSLQNEKASIGSKPYIETRARSELSYLRPGEIRFEIENAELLDNYTNEEWQALMKEKAVDEK
ncbi:MAG: hypothetical protein IJ229_13005 [Clostridia bacterium]|nr:hypothetical protein [Clostridia bacterium]